MKIKGGGIRRDEGNSAEEGRGEGKRRGRRERGRRERGKGGKGLLFIAPIVSTIIGT